MGRCKFRSDWLLQNDKSGYKISLWAEKHSDYELFCKLCTCVVNVSNKGFHAVLQHSEGTKHKKRCSDVFGGKQLVLSASLDSVNQVPSPSSIDPLGVGSSSSACTSTEQRKSLSTVRIYNSRDKATCAELVWTMKSICSNYSYNSCSDIKSIFECMLPGELPDGFSICPKKMHYLTTDALGVYFYEEMLEDDGTSPYTVALDETTNAESKKELQVTITYWSDLRNQVVTRHLETFFAGKADAVTLHSLVSKAITNANLSLGNLQMIASDGPNVNIKVFKLFKEEKMEMFSKGLVDIGTCPIHVVHNAFLKAMDVFGEDVMTLAIGVYHYFHGWPSRWEEYEIIQQQLNLPSHRFLKHTSTRWLSLIAAGERLAEQWVGLETYFLKHIPSKKSKDVLQKESVRKVTSLLKQPGILAQLHFTLSSAKLFQKFTKCFQSEAPLIHVLHSELLEIIGTLAGRVCKGTAVSETKSSSYDWTSSKLFQAVNLVPLQQIVLSGEVKDKVAQLSEAEVLSFLKNVQAHYITGAEYLVAKVMTNSVYLKQALGFLNPSGRKSERSCRYIRKVAKSLSMDIPDDQLADEWKCLQFENEPSESEAASSRVDNYWAYFMGLKKLDGSPKFPLVSKVIKAALCLSHGNADIERRFSSSKNVLTEEKTQMSCRTLNSILMVKDALRFYDNKPHLVPISKKLITLGQNAHKHYKAYIEEQKAAIEKEAMLKEEEIAKKKDEEEKLQNARAVKKRIEDIEKRLSEKKRKLSDTRVSANSLLSEATERLRKALKKGDLMEAQVAQGMLDGVMSLKKQESKEDKDIQTLQKTVGKKTNNLITTFFTAHSKKS